MTVDQEQLLRTLANIWRDIPHAQAESAALTAALAAIDRLRPALDWLWHYRETFSGCDLIKLGLPDDAAAIAELDAILGDYQP